MKTSYGFIGCGNMGGALIRAAAKAVSPSAIHICNRSEAKELVLAADSGALRGDAAGICALCDFIFLGVKPQTLPELAGHIRTYLEARKTPPVLVTMAAGTTIASIRDMFGTMPVIRIMPNLPVSVGEGMTLYASDGVSGEQLDSFRRVMACSGMLLAISEEQMDAGAAVSGCGPAYVCMFADALARGGISCGLSEKDAGLMASQMILGTARLLLETGTPPAEVAQAVCSPGGTTIEGIKVLEAGSFAADTQTAVRKAYEKALILAGKN